MRGGAGGSANSSGGGYACTGGSDAAVPVAGTDEGACPQDRPATTLASAQSPVAIAVDEVNVYWANSGNSGANDAAIMSVPKDGGVATTLVSPIVLSLWENVAIAAANERVYWTDSNYVMAVPREGGSTIHLVGSTPNLSTAESAVGLTVNAQGIFWAWGFGAKKGPCGGGVARASPDGSTVNTLMTYVVELGGAMNALHGFAVDSTNVYVSNTDILKISIDDGQATTLASDQVPVGPVVDNCNVYWNTFTSTTGYSLKSVAKAGGSIRTLTSVSGTYNVQGGQFIAIDGGSVYYSAVNGLVGKIMKVATNGGPITTLACSADLPGPLVVDDTSIYWLTQGGAVMKTAKD